MLIFTSVTLPAALVILHGMLWEVLGNNHYPAVMCWHRVLRRTGAGVQAHMVDMTGRSAKI